MCKNRNVTKRSEIKFMYAQYPECYLGFLVPVIIRILFNVYVMFYTSGWIGKRCEIDINECNITAGLCNVGECVNTPGSYKCNCTGTGYHGEYY